MPTPPNPIVEVTIGHADPNESPIKINDLIDLLNSLIIGEIKGEYRPYIVQASVPGADQQGYVWFDTGSQGQPEAIKLFYNGSWRRVYNGMPGEIRGYTGNPNLDFEMTGPNPGRGKIGGNYDGWQLCNGKNGSPDLSDKFILAGHMNNVGDPGWSGGWQSFIHGTDKPGVKTGGDDETLLTKAHMPKLDVTVAGYEYKEDPETAHEPAEFIIDTHYGELKDRSKTIEIPDPPNETQKPFPTLPPFIVMGLITFVGYESP